MEDGSWEMEVGRWKMGVGRGKLGEGSWEREVGSWEMEDGSWEMEDGSLKRNVEFGIEIWKLEITSSVMLNSSYSCHAELVSASILEFGSLGFGI